MISDIVALRFSPFCVREAGDYGDEQQQNEQNDGEWYEPSDAARYAKLLIENRRVARFFLLDVWREFI